MKFSLISTFVVLVIVGLCGGSPVENSFESLSPKEQIRTYLARQLYYFQSREINWYCPRPLTPNQIEFGNQKIEEFGRCGNATIDIFIDKLDDNVNLQDFDNIEIAVRRYGEPVCEIFDDIFRCIGGIGPVLDMCLNEEEITFKNKLFSIVPLIHQTLCLRNAALIAEIVEHHDGMTCMSQAFGSMIDIGFLELSRSNSTEFFGDETVCQSFTDVLNRLYVKVGECSPEVLGMVKEMLGFFCEGTKCERFVPGLQCY